MRQNKIKLCHQSIFCYIQDCFSSAVASIFSILLIRWIGAPVPGFSGIVILWTALSVLFTAIGLLLTGSYRIVGRYITPRSYLKKILTILFKALMMSVIVFVTLNHNSMVSPLLGAILALTDFIFTSLGLLSPLLLSAYTARYHHDDVCILVSRKNALVVGTDDQAVKYALDLDRTGDFNVVGLVSTDSQNDGLVINDYHVYYSHDLNEIDILGWRLGGVDCVFIPPKSGQGLLSGKGQKNVIHDDGMSSLGKAIKRGADFFLSALLIIIFSPLAVVCALAVKMEDGGPVFYRQQRVGLNGKLFNILKFRSMHVDAEHDGARFCSGCDDPRLTRVGTFLRAHHLDELPQLLNVFVGDMSFVGYRPERPCFIARIIEENPRYDFLYQIRPGVTSYATLYNGYTDTFEKMLTRLDLDLYYLRHHSIGFDMKVLFLTFISIVSGKKF